MRPDLPRPLPIAVSIARSSIEPCEAARPRSGWRRRSALRSRRPGRRARAPPRSARQPRPVGTRGRQSRSSAGSRRPRSRPSRSRFGGRRCSRSGHRASCSRSRLPRPSRRCARPALGLALALFVPVFPLGNVAQAAAVAYAVARHRAGSRSAGATPRAGLLFVAGPLLASVGGARRCSRSPCSPPAGACAGRCRPAPACSPRPPSQGLRGAPLPLTGRSSPNLGLDGSTDAPDVVAGARRSSPPQHRALVARRSLLGLVRGAPARRPPARWRGSPASALAQIALVAAPRRRRCRRCPSCSARSLLCARARQPSPRGARRVPLDADAPLPA